MATYRTGTITVTNGSKAVTGVSTLFKTAGVVSGDQLYIVDANNIPTGYLYEVDVVDSDTLITLKQNYQGTTASGQSYMIMNMAGNQTVPNFASRLAPIMQSWSDVTENINTTPQINGIPQAGETGKIDKGWLPDATAEAKGVVKVGTNLSVAEGVVSVPDATETVKGVVELATSAEVLAGVDTERVITPATFTAKILGTVSEVNGVPTGAVIERGSNANGYYVKFADGTMVCWATGISVSGLTIDVMTDVQYTFPVAFSSPPSTSVGLYIGANAASYITTKNGGGNLTQCNFNIISTSSSYLTVPNGLDYHAIGRWY